MTSGLGIMKGRAYSQYVRRTTCLSRRSRMLQLGWKIDQGDRMFMQRRKSGQLFGNLKFPQRSKSSYGDWRGTHLRLQMFFIGDISQSKLHVCSVVHRILESIHF